ncbi:Rpn family recombination-promoting nuclease/putative transposase [uncultured Thiodictyon sp.]|uniref:Rpn family recombination-promoting nuclease/putative transposase n=1 Tax=uncultured Thiodictyon sp. TaxID=1846217 RepID=UPI0025F343D6|nr:Rpn family recombination-promoting nuclease/putative transposase [uncultured Thiodictyon sp.]
MDDIATPHDAFFRESFGRREIAQDFLRHYLPASLLARIDLGTLEISKDTYYLIPPNLAPAQAPKGRDIPAQGNALG